MHRALPESSACLAASGKVRPMTSLAVTALAPPTHATRELAPALTAALAAIGLRGQPATVAGEAVRVTLELAPEPAPRARAVEVRRALAAALTSAGVAADLAVRPAELCRPPRLLVFDMDSTLITIEVIDELARRHGVGAEVAQVTERAMRGELDFEASLRARVGKLRGLPATALDEVAANLELSPGAERLIAELSARGAKVAIASGGFTFAAHALQRRLGLSAAFANLLEVIDGKLTGQVLGEVVTAERKAEVVRQLAAEGGFGPQEAIAVGDGANDRLMLAAAGFGVAFRAKPALAAAADATIDHGGLERVLTLLGS